MGKNKLAKFAELNTYDHVVQVPFNLLKEKDFELKGKWKDKFFRNDYPLVLELGCGKGEYTVGLARRFPDKNFIGVDIKGARMWKGAREIHLEGLRNAGLLRTNIELLSSFFAADEVSEIWITFPDPQMKKTSKRLTSTRFIGSYNNFLKPGGVIHLKTDSNFLYKYTSAMIRENNFDIKADTSDLYGDSGVSDEILSIKTYYELQWLSRGIKIKYLQFIPVKKELREPEIEIEEDDYRSFGRSGFSI